MQRLRYFSEGSGRKNRTVCSTAESHHSGKTPTISSDALIGIAETFKVSTDYILGLSSVSVRKNYDISQLGLSEKAVKGLVTEK